MHYENLNEIKNFPYYEMLKKKMGRPALPEKKVRKPGFSVRLDDDEAAEIERAIAASGVGKSEWARDALLSKARKRQ